TLDAPSLRPFLQLSTRRDLREQVYRAYATRASSGQHDNTGLMASILSARQRMSRMLGYADYASLSTAEKMVGTPAAVWALLDKLHAVALPAAQREVAELTKFAQARGHAGSLAPYDTAYWINRHLEEHFGIDEEAVRQYFPLPAVMDGMFSTLSNVFNISWAELGGSQRPSVWHKDVHCYSVHEGSAPTHNNAIASFLFDPYARPATKNGGAWADECVGRTTNPLLTRGLPGGVRLPVAHLVCNGSAPVGGNPSLMTHNDVLTLWHEMGHGLQLMLTRVGEGNVAGISGIEWDAVELPSQFAEEFAFHPAVLKLMSSHVDTGEPLSDDLIARLRGARTHMAALNMLRQLFLASTDMALHSADRTPAFACDASAFACGFDPFALTRGMASTHTVIPPLPEDRFLCTFSHIFSGGYAAGYFSYKHAEVMAADAFAAFEEAGLVGKSPAEFSLPAVNAMGKRFRDTVLSLGGSVHPTQVFRSFRGREPSVEPLL
ncbi:M3 family peptidase, partial [archaeon]